MNYITISKPLINNMGNVSRLEAVIIGPDFSKVHYFEVESKYEKYLCVERCDAFVVSLLYFALVNGYNIRSEAAISEKLYYQLTSILIPTMNNYYPDRFHKISITADISNQMIENAKGVGCAVSGGVDSFYTIISNMNHLAKDYRVTHLLVANSFNVFYGDNDTRKRFKEIADNAQIIADDLKIPLVKIYSNHSEFWFPHYQNVFCAKYASYPLALQKLFGKYYFSSGYEYKDFSFTTSDWDSSHYDAVSAPNLSTENFDFILSGGGINRANKIKYIADNSTVQKYLQVCNLQKENCSVCNKCMRTEIVLYSIGMLNCFSKSFDLNKFEKYKNKYILKMMYQRGIFDKENINLLKDNNIKIPSIIIVKSKLLRILYLIKELFVKNKTILKIYKRIRRSDDTIMLEDIERYNVDKEFAKDCDNGII
ncbi:MAG: hypothetical protein IJV15_13670 [Lachnospiraceae bacterium]|nr:hypothetical protein [Lachnospiraceae bacterium]